MITIWTAYFVAAVAASGIFVAAGWRSRRDSGLTSAAGWRDLPVDPLWGEGGVAIAAADAKADAGVALRVALKRLGPVIANQSVQAEIAVPAGLLVRMKCAALADLLEELLTAAIHGAPASRLLLTAATHGDRIHVSVTDDMPGADSEVRQGRVRGLTERIAMRGGVLDVNVRQSEGTTMTLRLAAVI